MCLSPLCPANNRLLSVNRTHNSHQSVSEFSFENNLTKYYQQKILLRDGEEFMALKVARIVTGPLWGFLLWAAACSAVHPLSEVLGTNIHTKKGAQMLHETLACYSRRGQWVRNPTPRKLPWIRETYGWETECDRQIDVGNGLKGEDADRAALFGGEWKVGEALQWEWQVNSCPWKPLDYEHFCKAMGYRFGRNASVLIVGDELAWGFERRLFYNLLAGASENYHPVNLFPQGCTWQNPNDKTFCSGYRYCHDILDGQSVSVRFVRSDNLSMSPHPGDRQNLPWVHAAASWDATVVMLSHSAPNVAEKDFEDTVARAAEWMRRHHPNSIFMYRNAPSPRVYCRRPTSGGKEPTNSLLPDTEEVYAQQNKIAHKVIMEAGGVYLDVNATLAKWPLDQQGCLDFCQPGPGDAWVHLFFNALMEALPKVDPKAIPTKNGAFMQSLQERWRGPACKRIRVPDPALAEPPPLPATYIPGSKIKTAAEWARVAKRLECFSRSGAWVYNAAPRPLAWQRIGSSAPQVSVCDARHMKAGGVAGPEADAVAARGGEWKVQETLKWEWQTGASCPLERVSRERFCKTVGPGRSIMFVGDSMTASFERQVLNNLMVGLDLEKYPPINLHPDDLKEFNVGSRTQTCRGWAICHDILTEPISIHFCFNRALSLTRIPLDGEAPWITTLDTWKPSILVVNRGAHYCKDQVFLDGSRDALRYIRLHYPEMLIIWRNTAAGHWNCTSYTGPLKSPVKQTLAPQAYHWTEFTHQNALVQPLLHEVRAVYMDIEYLTSLRPDGHPGPHPPGSMDCLHYCQPGIQDTWVLLLQNILQELL